jgi:hypothetical protein
MRAMRRRSLPIGLALLFLLLDGTGNSRCDALHARYEGKACPEVLCAIECNDNRDPENPAVCDGYTEYCCNNTCGICAPLDAVCPAEFCEP